MRPNGFTLIELMLALTLGLIMIAAAVMLLLSAMRSQSLQHAMADLQDHANFGLNYMTQDIRLANLNAATPVINDQSRFAGIVLSAHNLAPGLTDVDPHFLSSGQTGLSNVQQASDQLVIQYQPVTAGGFDCEGRKIAANQVVIQRYFLRKDHQAATDDTNPLALVCDAGYYTRDQATAIQNDGGTQGEIIMKRVDHFRVLLSVINQHHQRRYISIHDYMALTEHPKPRILAVYLAVLIRSLQPVGHNQASMPEPHFWLLDQKVMVKPNARPAAYIRRVIAQEVALRNGLSELD